MSKHAAGPWVRKYEGGPEEVVTASGTVLAQVKPVRFGARGETGANARLMAAAPDLYEALVRVLMWEPRSTEAACEQDYRFAADVLARLKEDL